MQHIVRQRTRNGLRSAHRKNVEVVNRVVDLAANTLAKPLGRECAWWVLSYTVLERAVVPVRALAA